MQNEEKKAFLKALVQVKRDCDRELKPNSWEWVTAIREELKTDTENYPWRAASEELWSAVTAFQDDEYLQIDRDSEAGLTPLEAIVHWTEIPRYPPVEVLATIAEAFEIYLQAEGKLSLEDVFFGETKKSVGNYSARKARYSVFRKFELHNHLNYIGAHNKQEESPNLEMLAERYLLNGKEVLPIKEMFSLQDENDDDIEDVDSFLRGYRRWKKAGKPLA